ncbi:MAG: hypothetical protein L0Y38_04740 [Methylococcaceae bacterium]|nr:hypothetical protein [Methylococcaceae bacterium]
MNQPDFNAQAPEIDPLRYVDRLAEESGLYPLLELLALAIRIEPHLLRNARLRVLPQSDVSIETEIWFSPMMRSQNVQACVMWDGIAREMVKRLKKD